MTDRGILFSGPMVRALLAGTKTQTRRGLKGETAICREPAWQAVRDETGIWRIVADTGEVSGKITPSMRIAVGDRLYVREHWRTGAAFDAVSPRDLPTSVHIAYEADDDHARVTGRFRQGMHMPRWASRITLTVTDVRVQRLQDISNEDCIAEGVPVHPNTDAPRTGPAIDAFAREHGLISHYGAAYRRIWKAINGPGSWDDNPWVAAYSFKVAQHNIDQIGAAR